MDKDIKLLDRVISSNKARDFLILQQLAEGFTEEEVAKNFNLTEGRISQILKPNKALRDELTMRSELAEKAGRIRYAYKQLRKKKDRSHKDSLDWLQYVKSEIVGDKPLVDQSTHINVVRFDVHTNPDAGVHLRDAQLADRNLTGV